MASLVLVRQKRTIEILDAVDVYCLKGNHLLIYYGHYIYWFHLSIATLWNVCFRHSGLGMQVQTKLVRLIGS